LKEIYANLRMKTDDISKDPEKIKKLKEILND